jgi:hypothetical protein
MEGTGSASTVQKAKKPRVQTTKASVAESTSASSALVRSQAVIESVVL